LPAAFAPTRRRPSVVFILMDQWRAKDSPVNGTSATVSRLPIDRK
jgi:arylsulfatase A-like enzyme